MNLKLFTAALNNLVTLSAASVLLAFASTAFAGVDMTLLGPKKYDRLKGAPTVYTDSFNRCDPSDSALLRIQNGDGKASSITGARISVNGVLIFADKEFKQQTLTMEKPITVQPRNKLTVELQSSSQDTSFLIIEIVGKNCDNTPPVISSPVPADLALLNNPVPIISALYQDEANGSGIQIDSVRLTVDGVDVTSAASVNPTGIGYTPAFPFPDGLHTVSLAAADRAANSASLTWRFTTDTEAPKFTMTSHHDGQYINTPTITLAGSIDDPAAGVTINGGAAQIGGGSFTTEGLSLAEGSNTFGVVATDPAGNSRNGAITLTLDTVLPLLSVSTLSDGAYTNKETLNISGTVTDAGGIDKLLVNGASVAVDAEVGFSHAVVLKAGANPLLVEAIDRAGNRIIDSRTINLDQTAPQLIITTPADNSKRAANLIEVAGTVDEQATVEVKHKENVHNAVVTGSSFTATVTADYGYNTIEVTARDRAGNPGSDKRTVIFDDKKPSLAITEPTQDLRTNKETMILKGTAADADGLTAVAVTIAKDGETFTPPLVEGVFQQALSFGEEKNCAIVVTATDEVGNSVSAQRNVILDITPPAVIVTSPVAGLLTRSPKVTVSGTLSEENTTVNVNGAPAIVVGTSFTLADVALAEGLTTITAAALDQAGNPGSAGVTVTLDSTPPGPPVINALTTPTNVATIAVSGVAEAGAGIKVFAGAAYLGSVSADAPGTFVLPGVTLSEGVNSFTATATDAAGNESMLSLPVAAVLDTMAPTITVASPAENQFLSVAQLSVNGSIDEPLSTLLVNGQPATLNNMSFDHPLTLTPGLNTITLIATDLAGNSATKTVVVTLDSTPPVVTITAPLSGSIARTTPVTVTGAISKAYTTATVNGVAIAVTDKTFSFTYNLSEGDNTLTIEATDRAGNKGNSAVIVALDSQLPVLSLQAPAEATAGANVAVTVNASDNNRLTLVELKADGVPIWSGESAPSIAETVSYRLSPSLNAGSEVVFQARGIDAAGNEGTANATIRITQAAMGPGYIQGKVLDDLRGLRMEGATVAITDGKGETHTLATAVDGGYFLEIPSGNALVRVSRSGYTSVERVVAVMPEKKATALDARLTKIDDAVNVIDSVGGVAEVEIGTGRADTRPAPTIDLTIPSSALSASADVRLTPVSNQGLAGVLPSGWSPLAAAELRFLDPVAGTPVETSLTSAATLTLPLPQAVKFPPDSIVTLAAYNVASRKWIAKGSAIVAADGLSASAEITTAGDYALVIADPPPNAPPIPVIGQDLQPSALSLQPDFSLISAAGKVVPQASPPSTGLKAAGEVIITAKEGASPVFTSGLVLNSRITESFDLKSGDKAESPAYTQDIVLYRYPCVTNIGAGALAPVVADAGLRTTFPVSPSKDYTIVELLLGKVGMEITVPDTTDSGIMVGTDGGRLVDADGNILAIPPGALSQTTPVSTKNGAVATGAVGDDFTLIKMVEVNLTRQTLAASATLSIPAPDGFDPSLPVVVARQIDVKGVAKLKLVALAKKGGSLISSDTAFPGIALPGITTCGNYYFLQAKGPIGFAGGTVTDASNNAYTGSLVKADTSSLVDVVPSTGKYLLAVPVVPFTATATDLYIYDEGHGTGAVTAANQVVTLDVRIVMIPPTIVSMAPNGVNVQPNVPVVITFSKGMDRNSIDSSTLRLTDSAGTAVAGVFTFSVDGKVVTFTPAELLMSEKSYTITISGGIKDLQDYPLGNGAVSSFTVRKTTPPPMPAAGAITATFPDADGFVTVTATQGSAEPGNTVLLINDTTGEIVSVTPASNGSFTGKVRAQLGDEIKIVLMDHSGNQTLVSYITYKSGDGKYLVTAKGGKVEGEGGTVLEIPEGALVGPAVVKIALVAQNSLPHPVPTGGRFLGAVNVDTGGLAFQKEVHLSIPVPSGLPAGAVPFLAQPHELTNPDGTVEKVYAVIDSVKIVNGRLTTASPPFDGVMGFGIFTFLYVDGVVGEDVVISGTAYQDMDGLPGYTPGPDPKVNDRPIRGAVIRAPGAENFVSFTNSSGHYATYGFTVPGACRNFPLTAIHPLTMNKVTANVLTCDAPYYVSNFNFRLAEKDTVLPDKTPPVISLDLTAVPGQGAAFSYGIIPVGTDIKIALEVKDQTSGPATLTVNYRTPDATVTASYPVQLAPGPAVLATPASGEVAALWRFPYVLTFSDPVKGTSLWLFRPKEPGVYVFTVEASDEMGNKTTLTRQIRAFPAADIPVGVDGAPIVDGVTPAAGAGDIMVNTVVRATFNEPVDNVTGATFYLLDTKTNTPVPAYVTMGLESGRQQAILTPLGNLHYARKYEVVLTQGIHDANPNPSADGQTLPLPLKLVSSFTTKVPDVHDLAGDQFQDARDVALFSDFSEGTMYAYVTAGPNGWRVIDVTEQASPDVVDIRTSPAGASWTYRYAAVDQFEKLLAITENIRYADGNQYGYVRFYDLAADPAHPVAVGREKLAEAFSGIPGRVVFHKGFAYVATAGVGLQVVDVAKARERQSKNLPSDGSTIIGGLGTVGMGQGSPNDLFLYSDRRGLLTTNPGHLLVLQIDDPAVPQFLGQISAGTHFFTRIAAAEDFQYLDADGTIKGKDLAVAATREGMVVTVDLTDPAVPAVIGNTSASSADGPILDIAFNKWTGLAFATTFGKVRVYDIRDPYHPALLETIPDGQLTTTTGAAPSPLALPVGPAVSLAEQDGWVFLANQNIGMQTLGLGSLFGLGYCPNTDCY